MAAGKTTVARALGSRLTWRVEDIDDLIETHEHRSIADIFARQGEAYFRAIEREALVGLLPLRQAVVATGGGTFVEPDNRAIINRDGASIWLDISFEQVVARLPPDGASAACHGPLDARARLRDPPRGVPARASPVGRDARAGGRTGRTSAGVAGVLRQDSKRQKPERS